MSFASKPCTAPHRKRLPEMLVALVALSFCALTGGCGNDDAKAPVTSNVDSEHSPTSNSNSAAVLSANPSSIPASPSPAAVTIQSPALPASSVDAALSAAASAPLATPVIHTVD